MKRHLALAIYALTFSACACEEDLVGSYFLKGKDGTLVESLRLRSEAGHLVAYTQGATAWELNPHQPEPFAAQDFATFTRQSAPPGYCGILVSGAIVARVAEGWQWAGITATSGFVIIGMGGPREAFRK